MDGTRKKAPHAKLPPAEWVEKLEGRDAATSDQITMRYANMHLCNEWNVGAKQRWETTGGMQPKWWNKRELRISCLTASILCKESLGSSQSFTDRCLLTKPRHLGRFCSCAEEQPFPPAPFSRKVRIDRYEKLRVVRV